jgi:hypothetical protein
MKAIKVLGLPCFLAASFNGVVMKHYNFVQGLLIGVCLWGAISVGLRYLHYQWEAPIPRVIMVPPYSQLAKPQVKARTYASSKLEIDQYVKSETQRLEKVTEKLGTRPWEAIKETASFLANIVTIVGPMFSGLMSLILWRRQRRLLMVTK